MKTSLKEIWKKWGQTFVGVIIGLVIAVGIYILSNQQARKYREEERRYNDKKQFTANMETVRNPQTAYDYYTIGEISLLNNNVETSIKNFEKAIDIDSTDCSTYYKLGDAYSTNSDKKDYDKAIEYYKKALINDECYCYYYFIIQSYIEKKDYNKAIEYYDKAIEIKQNLDNIYPYYYARGTIYEEKQNYEEAIEFYNKSIASNNDYAIAYYKLGNIYSQLENLVEAIKCYNEAIKIQPNADTYNELGNIYCYTKQEYDKAIEYYNKAIELRKNNTDTDYIIYNTYYHGLKIQPNDMYIFYNNLGYAHLLTSSLGHPNPKLIFKQRFN